MANISSKSEIVIDASVQQTIYTQFIKVARKVADDNLVLHGTSFKQMASDPIPVEISDADLEKSSFPHAPLSRRMIGILGERKSEPGISVYFRSADVIKKVYAALVERDENRDGKIDDAFASQDLEINLDETAPESLTGKALEANDDVAQSEKIARINDFLTIYRNSVFNVHVTQNDTDGGSGTGFLVGKTRDGKGGFDYLVMTNAHVVDSIWMAQLEMSEAYENKITLATKDGNLTVDAVEMIGTDPLRDIAILKFNSPLDLVVPPSGKSSKLKLLDDMIGYGNSLGNDMRPSMGKLLDDKYFGLFSITQLSTLRSQPIGINGNSGGPIFNTKGEVVAVHDAGMPLENTNINVYQLYRDNLLIPVEDAMTSMQMILAGNVHYGDWGVHVGPLGLPEIRAILPDELPRSGIQVTKIIKDGAADKAGLKPGDIIVSINGDSDIVSVPNGISQMNKFYDLMRRSQAGGSFTLKVYRDAEKKTFETSVISQDKTFVRSNTTKTGVGLFVQDISEDLRDLYAISDSVQGILVVMDSSKRGANLNNEIITKVNDTDVKDVKSFIDMIVHVKKSGGTSLTVTVVTTVKGYTYLNGGQGAQRLVTLSIE